MTPTDLNAPRPFLKWVGGKRRLLPHILELLPDKINTYHEPFLGGGAVALAVADRCECLSLSDLNAELITVWRVVRDDPKSLCKLLRHHDRAYYRTKVPSEYYYWVRGKARPTSEVGKAARFIFLNRTCFNGLYRVNKANKFNVPFGSYKKPRIVVSNEIEAASEILQAAEIRNATFAIARDRAAEGDTVYFDPPFLPLSTTANFTGYTPGGFGADRTRALCGDMTTLKKRGVFVLLSNNDTPLVRKIFKRFRFKRIPIQRTIAADGKARSLTHELLIY